MHSQEDSVRRSAIIELCVIGLVASTVFILAVIFDLFEQFVRWSRAYEQYYVDEFITLCVVLAGGLGVFSYRRWKQLSVQLVERKRAEQMLSMLNQQLQASEQQLRAANQQLQASEQQLRAANQQLQASEQQLRAMNQRLRADEKELRKLNLELTDEHEFSESIVNTIRESLVVLDKHMRVISANHSFYQTFNATEQQTEGRLLYELGNREWDIPELHRLLEDVLSKGIAIEGFEVEHDFEAIGRKTMLLNARRLRRKKGKAPLTLLAVEDITERKRAEEALRAANQQLQASEQQLRAANQQLRASEQQLRAANQQLKANEQRLRAEINERKNAERKLLDYQQRLKALASQLALAEEHERRQVAADLHDRIGQHLVISKLWLDRLRQSVAAADVVEDLDAVRDLLSHTIQETRSLTFDLSSPTLHELGFEEAVREWLSERVEKQHGIATEFKTDRKRKLLSADLRAILFRNVRELLFNVIKHAGASKVKVFIRKIGNDIEVSVEDDGRGFDPAEVAAKGVSTGAFGLFSIRERLEQLGGHLQIDSEPGRGCKATMTAPLQKKKG